MCRDGMSPLIMQVSAPRVCLKIAVHFSATAPHSPLFLDMHPKICCHAAQIFQTST